LRLLSSFRTGSCSSRASFFAIRFDTTLMAVSTPIISSAVSAPWGQGAWYEAARVLLLNKSITSVSVFDGAKEKAPHYLQESEGPVGQEKLENS